MSEQTAYAAAGVDIDAGDRAVELMKEWVGKTRRSEVMGGIGGFAGLFDAAPLARMAHPVLATSTDGVGTKVAVAQALGVHDTIGFDLVGMVVDDLVVCGAEPLFMTDYVACGAVVPERIKESVVSLTKQLMELQGRGDKAAAEEALKARFAAKSLDGLAAPADGLNSDIHADAAYRAHLIAVMARRAVQAATSRE